MKRSEADLELLHPALVELRLGDGLREREPSELRLALLDLHHALFHRVLHCEGLKPESMSVKNKFERRRSTGALMNLVQMTGRF